MFCGSIYSARMTDQTNLLRFANTGLLLGISIILVLILRGLPKPAPTKADFEFARLRHDVPTLQTLRSRLPAVAIEGEVEITGDVGLSEPITVDGSVSVHGPVSIESSKRDSIHVTLSDVEFSKGVQLPVEVMESAPITIDSQQPVVVQIVR